MPSKHQSPRQPNWPAQCRDHDDLQQSFAFAKEQVNFFIILAEHGVLSRISEPINAFGSAEVVGMQPCTIQRCRVCLYALDIRGSRSTIMTVVARRKDAGKQRGKSVGDTSVLPDFREMHPRTKHREVREETLHASLPISC